jgi:glycosyltransferase involved in cell wall biosynthesis
MAAAQTMIACFDEDSELCSFVREGNCGIAVSPDSSQKLKEAILELYSDREKCREMGNAGYPGRTPI